MFVRHITDRNFAGYNFSKCKFHGFFFLQSSEKYMWKYNKPKTGHLKITSLTRKIDSAYSC